jgi:hypothetical protein
MGEAGDWWLLSVPCGNLAILPSGIRSNFLVQLESGVECPTMFLSMGPHVEISRKPKFAVRHLFYTR